MIRSQHAAGNKIARPAAATSVALTTRENNLTDNSRLLTAEGVVRVGPNIVNKPSYTHTEAYTDVGTDVC